MATIYHLSQKQMMTALEGLMERRMFVEDTQYYLDKKEVKKLAFGFTPKHIYVAEEKKNRTPHHKIPYNAVYREQWGNQPLYGNIIFVYTPKTYEKLPADVKITDLTTITL